MSREPPGSLSSATLEGKKKDDDKLRRFAVICYSLGKKIKNDDELKRFAVIYYT
jgi:hypothetical protein